MTNYVYIATSLDGFIATNEGHLDWLDEIPNPEKSDYGYAEFMAAIDALVMGRKTFDKVRSFDLWPYDKPVYVLSSGKPDVPDGLQDKIKVVNQSPREVVDRLHGLGYQNLYIDGGRTIQEFLQADLIDEMIITRVPVLLGNGIPLFSKLSQRLYFSHEKTEILNGILVKSHYVRLRE
jgi:dihydrofolate reductase